MFERSFQVATAAAMLAFALFWSALMLQALRTLVPPAPAAEDPASAARNLARQGVEGHVLSGDPGTNLPQPEAPEPE